MFGRRPAEKFDPDEYRVHVRRPADGLTVYVDGNRVHALDYSKGGVRVTSDHGLKRVATVEIYRGAKLLRTTAAILAWDRGGQAGYKFCDKLRITEASPATHMNRSDDARSRPSNDAISGSKLRNRLHLG